MRPIPKGYYKIQDLYDGSLDIEMVARCNDAIDMDAENELRYIAYIKSKDK